MGILSHYNILILKLLDGSETEQGLFKDVIYLMREWHQFDFLSYLQPFQHLLLTEPDFGVKHRADALYT